MRRPLSRIPVPLHALLAVTLLVACTHSADPRCPSTGTDSQRLLIVDPPRYSTVTWPVNITACVPQRLLRSSESASLQLTANTAVYAEGVALSAVTFRFEQVENSGIFNGASPFEWCVYFVTGHGERRRVGEYACTLAAVSSAAQQEVAREQSMTMYTQDHVTDWLQSQSGNREQKAAVSPTVATLLKILHDESSSSASPWDALFDAAAAADMQAAAAAASAAHSHLETQLNFSVGQGHSGQLAFLTLALAALSRHASTMCQTGFNSGHSAVTALSSNPAISVLSFDLGEEAAVAAAASYIDAHVSFSGRHELVLGDSRDTLPATAAAAPRLGSCDISFVDGGHFGDVPLSDIMGLGLMSHDGTLLVVDDTPFLRDVEAAWSLVTRNGLVEELGCWKGHQAHPFLHIRSFCIGRYTQLGLRFAKHFNA